MIKDILVVGAGSAGLMAALAFKRKLAGLNVRVLRDPAIGVIGVGESTTPNVPSFLFGFLGISTKRFYELANPTWKIGIHFLWGPRPCFEYSFMRQLDSQWSDLPMPNGFYCWDDFSFGDLPAALLAHGKAFPRGSRGEPLIGGDHAFHLYNPDFVKALETIGTEWGIEYIDGTLAGAERAANSDVAAVVLADGRRLSADFFVDASGFKSELLGRTLEEPFVSFDGSLFCDRAVVGGWDRTKEDPILPYTTAETMDAGWCWRIEHEKIVNRGYVFCSADISDDEAHEEFLRKNPKAATWANTVKFRSGRYERGWVGNVVALGNAGGFVEPLEATALMLLTGHVETLVTILRETRLAPTPTTRDLYNGVFASGWDEIKDFLSIHYRFNTRLDTPFWRRCQNEVDVSGASELLKFYDENGPVGLCRHVIGGRGREIGIHSAFGVEGYLVILTGCKVPYQRKYEPSESDWATWQRHKVEIARQASLGLTVEESLAYVRHPGWTWNADVMRDRQAMGTR